mmetsp:Transcript_10368/g.16424  ORF Transcript_10368/g.16424 Transcript_10368/m.16424 type:complete len:308 (-) Transcript_10368:2226-3149(-)
MCSSSRRSSSSAKASASLSSELAGTLKCIYAFVVSAVGPAARCRLIISRSPRDSTESPSVASPRLILNLYPAPKRVLSRTVLPRHRKRPFAIIAIVSPRISASSIECVVKTTQRSCLAASTTSHTWRRLMGSMPVVGSSRKTTCGLPMSAMATLKRRRIPPENVPAQRSAASERRTSSIRRMDSTAMACFCTPLMAAKSCRCSRAVRLAHSVSNCGHTPITRRTALMPTGCATVRPITSALPREGGTNPVSILTVVVLPAPLGPSSASKCFLRTEYHGALTAKKGLPPRRNSATSPRISMAFSGLVG